MERQFISVEDAQEQILTDVQITGAERVMLSESAGRFLAETVLAPEDSPPFDNSAMDGIAVRGTDLADGASFTLVGESAAGSPFEREVKMGQAIRIMTGAMVPDGADTVVVRESCTFGESTVVVENSPAPGVNIRHKGSSMAKGELTIDVGHRLTAGDLGLLASFQRATISVVRRPRVAIITTGDELVDVGTPREASQIVNSNAYMLSALIRRDGGDPWTLPIVPDQMWETQAAFRRAIAGADVVMSVGGVSVGDHDHVKAVLSELSDGMAFWKVQMKPGKPLAYGRASANNTPMIGLPGNPTSSFVCYHQFVRPLLLMMQSAPRPEAILPRIKATLEVGLRSSPKRRHYVLGTLSLGEGAGFVPFRDQSSGSLWAICGANALGIVEVGSAGLAPGDPIDVHPLPL